MRSFEDEDVTEIAVSITRAGDGLSDALKVAPAEHAIGDEVNFLLRGRVTKVRFEEVKPGSDDLRRVEVYVTQAITVVPDAMADPVLRDAEVMVRQAMEEQAGVIPLFPQATSFEDMDEEAKRLYVLHSGGMHAETPVEGCPLCELPPGSEGETVEADEEDEDNG